MYNGGGGFLHSRFDGKRRKRGKAMSTVLLKNGIVYDGLGNPGVPGDVLIRDDRIEKVGNLGDAEADRVIDAAGRVICPGFVDIHRHCDAKPLNDPLFTGDHDYGGGKLRDQPDTLPGYGCGGKGDV